MSGLFRDDWHQSIGHDSSVNSLVIRRIKNDAPFIETPLNEAPAAHPRAAVQFFKCLITSQLPLASVVL